MAGNRHTGLFRIVKESEMFTLNSRNPGRCGMLFLSVLMALLLQLPSFAVASYADGVPDATVTVAPKADVGDVIRLSGEGFTHPDGTGSVIAVKIDDGAYSHTEEGKAHNNLSIWYIIEAEDDGSFLASIPLPDGSVAGAGGSTPAFTTGEHTLTFLTGSLKDGDTVRSVVSDPFTATTPEQQAERVSVQETKTEIGGVLHVSGTGFTHPTDTSEGATVAIKIDDGAYSHTTAGKVHDNLSIWAIVRAAADGSFETEITLPDGAAVGAGGSTPAFIDGSHSLRFLTGSLKDGDIIRTIKSDSFIVGSYRPVGDPDVIDPSDALTPGLADLIAVTFSSDGVVVSMPNAEPGDWVHLSAYLGQSVRYPWGQASNFVVDANRQVRANALTDGFDEAGAYRIVARDVSEGAGGEVIGWTSYTVAEAPAGGGDSDGYDSGYAAGNSDGYNTGYTTGNSAGYNAGYAAATDGGKAAENNKAADGGKTTGNDGSADKDASTGKGKTKNTKSSGSSGSSSGSSTSTTSSTVTASSTTSRTTASATTAAIATEAAVEDTSEAEVAAAEVSSSPPHVPDAVALSDSAPPSASGAASGDGTVARMNNMLFIAAGAVLLIGAVATWLIVKTRGDAAGGR
jgi:hypothetical protein